jgi:CrcB protein
MPAMLSSLLAIAAGASLGAILRWLLANGLNALLPTMPPGTLVANLLGGYLIGVAVAFFAQHPSLPPAWRLFVVTGFLGGLTTFSSFSAEVVNNLVAGRTSWALATAAVHLLGSVGMTLLGMGTVALLRSAPTAS